MWVANLLVVDENGAPNEPAIVQARSNRHRIVSLSFSLSLNNDVCRVHPNRDRHSAISQVSRTLQRVDSFLVVTTLRAPFVCLCCAIVAQRVRIRSTPMCTLQHTRSRIGTAINSFVLFGVNFALSPLSLSLSSLFKVCRGSTAAVYGVAVPRTGLEYISAPIVLVFETKIKQRQNKTKQTKQRSIWLARNEICQSC